MLTFENCPALPLLQRIASNTNNYMYRLYRHRMQSIVETQDLPDTICLGDVAPSVCSELSGTSKANPYRCLHALAVWSLIAHSPFGWTESCIAHMQTSNALAPIIESRLRLCGSVLPRGRRGRRPWQWSLVKRNEAILGNVR